MRCTAQSLTNISTARHGGYDGRKEDHMKSFYHDMRNDDILTEREYDERMEECFSASLVYFGEYSSRSEALADLNGKYSYLKNNSYWNPAM